MARQFFAPTAREMELLLAQELEALGARAIRVVRAGVEFEGTLETAYAACLHSRIANRVLLPLKSFPASDPAKLYAGVKAIRWSDHLTPSNTLAVDFASSQSQITHTQFGALKVKDAIVDQFRSVTGTRPSVDVARPDVRINVYVLKDWATVSLDLAGSSLHERGYREQGVPAPLKENLAAAILMRAGWLERLKDAGIAQQALLDPMCGSGTLPIEAALMATRTPPGIQRDYFGFLGWKQHEPAVWDRLVRDARREIVLDAKKLPRIVGYDADFRAVRAAIANGERAGLRGLVHFEKREFPEQIEVPAAQGLFIMNPPYGERLGDVEQLKGVYKGIGDTLKQKFKGWTAGVFTGSPELAKCVGLKTSARVPLFNGAMECRLLMYSLYEGTRSSGSLRSSGAQSP